MRSAAQAVTVTHPSGGGARLPADHASIATHRTPVGGNTLDGGQCNPDAQRCSAPVKTLPADHRRYDTHNEVVGGNIPSSGPAVARHPYASRSDEAFPPGQVQRATHKPNAGGDLPADHRRYDTHNEVVGGNTLDAAQSRHVTQGRPGGVKTLPADHWSRDTQNGSVGGNQLAGSHALSDTHTATAAGNPHDAQLLILADALDDLERVRIATQNRLRSLISQPANGHDSAKGFASDEERTLLLAALKHANPKKWEQACADLRATTASRVVLQMADVTAGLVNLEHRSTLELTWAMRNHPLGSWVKHTIGIGEKQGARLLAAIGDPYIKPARIVGGEVIEPARPRLVSELRQYCGHGSASKRQRGVKTFWNPTAKMRLHLIAESCIKQRTSPYRAVYDNARMDWADRTGCPTCKDGICTDGHKHSHALRMVGKEILLDLWREAKEAS